MTAYDMGYTAYDNGVDFYDNPFHTDEAGHHDWIDGWLDAQEHVYNDGN